MPVKLSSSKAHVILTVDGEESETAVVMGHSYAYVGKAFFPSVISTRWRRKDGHWDVVQVDVKGSLAKANGTPGSIVVEREVFGWNRGEGEWVDNTPDWVKDAVLSNTP